MLPQAEQVQGETREPNARLKAYIVEVRKTPKGPQIVVSRTHPGLIKRLFELEVPEIADGVVEMKACAREPGQRTKIAVWSNDHNVDPVGACVGARGGRVRMVVTELRGEKVDIIPFSDDLPDFIAKAMSPAKVTEVRLSDDRTQADVIVPDFQLSLAIGKMGSTPTWRRGLPECASMSRAKLRPRKRVQDLCLRFQPESTTGFAKVNGSPTQKADQWNGTPPMAQS